MTDKKGILFVVSGPSGTGKGTICKKILQKRDDLFLSVSATTRLPREGEEEGVAYFFMKKEEFEQKIAEGDILEYALFCGNYYGTPRKAVEKMLNDGKDVILEIEVQGAMQIKEKYKDAVCIFTLPPSMAELEKRLRGRDTETEEALKSRLLRAKEEFEYASKYDYMILNDDIDSALARLETIIEAERLKIHRNINFIKEVQNS